MTTADSVDSPAPIRLDRKRQMASYRGTTISDDKGELLLTVETRRRLPLTARSPAEYHEPPQWQWLLLSTHVLDRPEQASRHAVRMWIQHQMHTLGWSVTDLKGSRPDNLSLTLAPADYALILAAANEHRVTQHSLAQQAELAWRTVIGDVPSHGEPGYLSKIKMAEISDVTRSHINIVWNAQRALDTDQQ